MIPEYAHHYPTFRRVHLAAVKDGLYHPKLPTFRRMDMDTASHKLPDEHSRTTTCCGPEDFHQATSTLFTPHSKQLNSAQITETGRQLHRYYTTPEELQRTQINWNEIKSKHARSSLLPLPASKDLHFVGYAVRYFRPEVTAAWRYNLRQEPSLDQWGQRPTPADVSRRYRDTSVDRSVAAQAWRC